MGLGEDRAAAVRRFFAPPAPVGVAAAYLFGSLAEGRGHRESDVDVAVLFDWASFPTARERFAARLRLAGELIAATHCNDVDLVVLNDAPPLFARRIVLEGERLVVADREIEHAFRRDVQLKAADLAPFLERARRRLHGVLAAR
jgi:predicted nucleotidyltransferase